MGMEVDYPGHVQKNIITYLDRLYIFLSRKHNQPVDQLHFIIAFEFLDAFHSDIHGNLGIRHPKLHEGYYF